MSTIEAIVLRRVVTTRSLLTGGALALHNYQMGMARADSEIVFRDDIGAFHYFKSDAKNELKYSQFGHIHDDRYYTETEIDSKVSELTYESSGVVSNPAPDLIYNGDGTMTMPSAQVRLYDNSYYMGIPKVYTVPAKTFTPVNLQDGAIIAHYNSGTPEYRVVDAWNFGAYNLSDAVIVYRSWKAYGDLHSNGMGSTGLGAIEKLGLRIGQTEYYHRTGNVGLALGSTSTPSARTVTITAANVWAALTQVDVLAFNSSTDKMELLSRTSGVWSSSVVTQWPNTYYNDNAGLVTMSNNKYGVVWVYRTIGNVKEVYLVLGTGEHNTASEAEKESPRSDMDYILYSRCMLVGRIIFQKGATTATDVQSAFDVTFNSSIVQSHQALSDLQGGQSGQYYHLTQLEWETKILGLGITGRIPLYSAERQITSSILSGDANGIYPIANGTKAIGSTSLRFSELWANTVYENGTSLALKYSPIGHTHDDRYYTESEVTSLLNGKEPLWERATVTSASNLNTYTVPGTYAVSNAAAATNMPSGAYGWGVLQVLPFSTGSLVQMYMPHRESTASTSGIWMRVCYTGTWQDWQHIYGDAYNSLKYATLSSANFTGAVTATDISATGQLSSTGSATFNSDAVIAGIADLRAEVRITGLLVGVSNADVTLKEIYSGFVNTATYTAQRTLTLPAPVKGRILTISNLGSSTTYGMLVNPSSGTTIHYGITPTLTGGGAAGIKSLILEGVSTTKWAVISMWTL